MNNGIIYWIIKFAFEKLDKLNLVELFKYVSEKLVSDKKNHIKLTTYRRIAVDIFIILKWILILLLWCLGISNIWVSIIVWYFIITNLYTYFYYHIWHDEALNTESFDKDRVRRRFVNLLQALLFSEICFGYLYNIPYLNEFTWSAPQPHSKIHALWFSISNSVAANYDVVKPFTGLGNSVAMIQLVITFIFVVIIISRSLPQTSSTK